MWEVWKEFVGAVMAGTGEEIRRAGSGAVVVFFCMIAFLFILTGIFMESRCAVMYYITSDGKRKLIGSLYVQREEGSYRIRIPGHFFEKSESIYYYIHLPEDFAHRHYMEEMLVELPSGKKRLAIKRKMQLKYGLGTKWGKCQ